MIRLCLIIALAFIALHRPALASGMKVDLELVLAIDASSSVNPAEFRLQMEGVATAFRHPNVWQAIKDAS